MSYKINYFIASDKDVASYEKRLSICLMSNGFSFSLTDVYDELLALGEVECNLNAPIGALLTDIRGFLAETRMQTFGLKEAELIVFSDQFVWIPQHLFDADNLRQYLDVMCKVPMGYSVFEDYNDRIKAHLVFSADNNILSAFKVAIPGIKIRCQHSKMVNPVVLDSSDQRTMMLINIRDGVTDFALFENKKLLLSNSYSCANIDETMFYALNISRQFHLEDGRLLVGVCGDIDREKFAFLKGYFADIALYTGRPLTLTVPQMQHIHTYRCALVLS